MYRKIVIFITFLLVGCTISPTTVFDKEDAMIPLSDIELMFNTIREKTDWGLDEDLLWGYYFIDEDIEQLQNAAKRLQQLGYTFIDIRENEDGKTYWLAVEKLETHTPQSLHERNKELESLAIEFGLDSYDGMDVGPVPEKP